MDDDLKCKKSPTGEHVWNYSPRPDNCRLGTCRYCEQQHVFYGSDIPATHTAAIMQQSEVKPETLERAAAIAESSIKRESDAMQDTGKKLKTGRIAEELRPEVARRLAAGEKPKSIAADIGYEVKSVYNFRTWHMQKKGATQTKNETETRNHETKAVKVETPIIISTTAKASIIGRVKRIKRGEINQQYAKKILTQYRQVLAIDLENNRVKARKLKQEIELTTAAIQELDAAESENRRRFDKIFSSIG